MESDSSSDEEEDEEGPAVDCNYDEFPVDLEDAPRPFRGAYSGETKCFKTNILAGMRQRLRPVRLNRNAKRGSQIYQTHPNGINKNEYYSTAAMTRE
jgi:hypothetical protein